MGSGSKWWARVGNSGIVFEMAGSRLKQRGCVRNGGLAFETVVTLKMASSRLKQWGYDSGVVLEMGSSRSKPRGRVRNGGLAFEATRSCSK